MTSPPILIRPIRPQHRASATLMLTASMSDRFGKAANSVGTGNVEYKARNLLVASINQVRVARLAKRHGDAAMAMSKTFQVH